MMPPDHSFTIKDFILEAKDDFSSPTTSTFYSNISLCKQLVNSIEEGLDLDRNGLSKMKKAVKAIYNGGCANSENKIFLSESLEKLGVNSTNREKEEFIGAAFVKFSFIVKELSALEKNLMQSLYNIIMFPVDNVLKGDLKGVKNDLKKPVDKALKEYEIKMCKIEKEKKAQAKEAGLIRTEISGAEIAEEMDRERKQLQYQMCEYLIKVNDIEIKKSFDLLLHYIEYFNAQCKYFRGGLEAIEHFQSFINELSLQLQQARQRKEDEKRELIDLRSLLKSSNTFDTYSLNSSIINDSHNEGQSNRRSIGYSLHQLQGNKQYGCYKSGYLLKKSESKMRVKVWQKRKCEVQDGFLYIWHSDESKPPTKINLLTCQIKTCLSNNQQDDLRIQSSLSQTNSSNSLKNCGTYFDLISCNRTYHFQVEDEHDVEAWISVLINNKEGALKKEFDSSTSEVTKCEPVFNNQVDSYPSDQNISKLRENIIEHIRKLPGNDCCVDCGSTQDPTWLATNFGVLTCIECSGIHREMGVHISRIQSLTLDNIGTSQLLIARTMSNNGFNDIMEAGCNIKTFKPKPNSTMDERNQFIRSKYLHRKYIIKTCTSELELLNDLEQAVHSKDIFFLLQVWAEGANLSSALPSNSLSETALHQAIMREYDRSSLHIVDFLVQNSPNLDAITMPDGNTALHYCVIYNRPECMKLLLRSKANYSLRNSQGKSPIDLARDEQNSYLIKLLECAEKNQKSMFENMYYSVQLEDPSTDFSDDDLDEKNCTAKNEDIRRANLSLNQNEPSQLNNRFRSSNRKFSFRYQTESESDSNDVMNSTNPTSKLSIFTTQPQSSQNTRPSSVVGDFHVVNIDTSNMSSFSRTQNNVFQATNTDSDNLLTRGTGSSGNTSRNSGRSRFRFSAEQPLFNSKDSTVKVLETNERFLNANRPFLSGHSRAASADISTNPKETNLLNSNQQITNKTTTATPSKISHHIRNNSVDNSLVTSAFSSAFTVKSTTSQPPQPSVSFSSTNKPAVPIKPSGIVSVFVPGSNTSITQGTSNSKSTGNIYGKVVATSTTNVVNQMPQITDQPTSTILNQSDLFTKSQPPLLHSGSVGTHPVPPPRKKISEATGNSSKYRRCVALYDCDADQADEISFKAGEIITVINEITNDDEWMEGVVEGDSSRHGLFPAIFVQFIE